MLLLFSDDFLQSNITLLVHFYYLHRKLSVFMNYVIKLMTLMVRNHSNTIVNIKKSDLNDMSPLMQCMLFQQSFYFVNINVQLNS